MIAALLLAAAAPQVFVSCDATALVAAHPIAVWTGGAGQWQQVHGAAAPAPAADGPDVERASCDAPPISNVPPVRPGVKQGGGSSRDGSLIWAWAVARNGARSFRAQVWTGDAFRTVVEDPVAPK